MNIHNSYTHTHLCWVVPCSITDVAAYDLATLLDSDTGLLHNVWRWCLYLQFIIPMSYVSVTAMHVLSSSPCSRVQAGRAWYFVRSRLNLMAFISVDMPSRYRYVVLKTVASWEIIGTLSAEKDQTCKNHKNKANRKVTVLYRKIQIDCVFPYILNLLFYNERRICTCWFLSCRIQPIYSCIIYTFTDNLCPAYRL